MAPKGRWTKKDKKDDAPVTKGPPVLPVRCSNLDIPDAIVVHIENYFTIAECERYFEVLETEIDWKRQEVTLNKIPGEDKTVQEPRLTAFMSDPGICYEYSKRENVGVGWHPAVLEIKEKAQRALEEYGIHSHVEFNSAQMNRYDGPGSALGLHCDNEPDLVPRAPIISVSFGATRDFRIQRKDDETRVWNVTLRDGSFLLMAGDMQDKYLHGVPHGGEKMVRFNITFRCCIPRAPLRSNGRAVRMNAEPDESGAAEDRETAVTDTRGTGTEEWRATAGAVQKRAAERGGAERNRWRGGARAAHGDRSTAATETVRETAGCKEDAKPADTQREDAW